LPHRLHFFYLQCEIGEWIPSSIMEAKLQRLVVKGLLPLKEVSRWRAPNGVAAPHPQPREVVSFTDFHKRGSGIPAFDFLHGFLHENGVQLHHLPPNAVLQLASFIVVCVSEGF
jgi:hypothetical protein